MEQIIPFELATKTGGPRKAPPAVPALDRNPRKHDLVAWRRDGLRLDTTRHDTREAAIEHARALPWIIYYQYAVMDGRVVIEQRTIDIPDGMAITDDGLPIAI